MTAPSQPFLDALRSGFSRSIAHVEALGITVESLSAEATVARLPFQPQFVGDIEHGVLHTGVITTLVDSVSGFAVLARLGRPARIATLDLRIDYLRPAVAEQALFCRVSCYRLTTHIAFVRASVWQQDETQAVAEGLGSFMVTEKVRI